MDLLGQPLQESNPAHTSPSMPFCKGPSYPLVPARKLTADTRHQIRLRLRLLQFIHPSLRPQENINVSVAVVDPLKRPCDSLTIRRDSQRNRNSCRRRRCHTTVTRATGLST